MEQIPFAALTAAERVAVVAALQRNGLHAGQVCVSKLHPEGGRPQAMVTAPGWCRSYDDADGWVAAMERDLLARARRATDAL